MMRRSCGLKRFKLFSFEFSVLSFLYSGLASNGCLAMAHCVCLLPFNFDIGH